MTKEITKAFILQEIQDKFKLREFVPSKFTFSEEVIPTYDIGPHLAKREVISHDVSITSIGGKLFFTVPQTERWRIKSYMVVFMGAGAYTVSGCYYRRQPGGATDFMYMDLTAGQTDSYIVLLPTPVLVDSGDTILMNIDGYTSTQDLRLQMDVEKEEIR